MTYSKDMRQLALQKIEAKVPVRQIAQELGIAFSTVQRWKKQPDAKVYPKNRKHRKILLSELQKDVETYPDAYLRERAERFDCSEVSIHRALKKLNISKKKNSESSEELS